MKLSRILIAAAAFLLAAAVSCRKEDEPIPVLTLTSNMVSHKGGKQAVTVAAHKGWRLDVDYLSAEKDWSVSARPAATALWAYSSRSMKTQATITVMLT